MTSSVMFRPRSSSSDGLGRRIEQEDVVRAFAVLADGVGEAAAAPRADLDDLAAGARLIAAGGSVENGLDCDHPATSGRRTSINS